MKLTMSRDWFDRMIDQEEGHEIAAGAFALSLDLSRNATVQSPARPPELVDGLQGCQTETGVLSQPAVAAPARLCLTPDEQLERDRERFYIVALLRAWKKPVTRAALNAGLVLMLNDGLRVGMLGSSSSRKKLPSMRVVEGLDFVLQEMELLGHIDNDVSRPQQVLTLRVTAPVVATPDKDCRRLAETMRVFERQRQEGQVVETEELIDAELDFIPA